MSRFGSFNSLIYTSINSLFYVDTPKYTVKKLLTDEFVHKGYFRRIKIKNHDPSEETQYEYDWGIRAVVEFKKTDVLNFVKRVYQMDDTALWQRFEKKATQEDQKRQAMICGNTERGPSQLVEEEEMVIEEAPMEQSGESPPVVKKGRRKAQLFNSQPELFSDSGSQRITRSSASGSSSQTPVTKKAKNAKQSTAKKQTVEKKCVPKRGSVVKHYDSPVQRLRKKKWKKRFWEKNLIKFFLHARKSNIAHKLQNCGNMKKIASRVLIIGNLINRKLIIFMLVTVLVVTWNLNLRKFSLTALWLREFSWMFDKSGELVWWVFNCRHFKAPFSKANLFAKNNFVFQLEFSATSPSNYTSSPRPLFHSHTIIRFPANSASNIPLLLLLLSPEKIINLWRTSKSVCVCVCSL